MTASERERMMREMDERLRAAGRVYLRRARQRVAGGIVGMAAGLVFGVRVIPWLSGGKPGAWSTALLGMLVCGAVGGGIWLAAENWDRVPWEKWSGRPAAKRSSSIDAPP